MKFPAALLTSALISPNCSSAFAAAASTAPYSRTSQVVNAAAPPARWISSHVSRSGSSRRPTRKTRAPNSANRNAIDLPSPVPPPVRKIARPFSKSFWNTIHHLVQMTERAPPAERDSNPSERLRMTFSKGARRLGGRHVNKLRDASAREWAAPSLLHIRRRIGGFPEIPHSIRGAVSAPGDFVSLCELPTPARSWQTAAGTARFQLFFQAAPYRASCRRGFLRTEA